ncbi:hypothetical protein HK104_006685 [Borealophlyctis nickersoniae]|nr:hypothetical protein HK104_006685 [Borealophlyctis nickersoniae]
MGSASSRFKFDDVNDDDDVVVEEDVIDEGFSAPPRKSLTIDLTEGDSRPASSIGVKRKASEKDRRTSNGSVGTSKTPVHFESSSDEASSSSDEEELGGETSAAQITIELVRQRAKFKLYSDKAKRAAKRFTSLSRLFDRLTSRTANAALPASNGETPRRNSLQGVPVHIQTVTALPPAPAVANPPASGKTKDRAGSPSLPADDWRLVSQNTFDVLCEVIGGYYAYINLGRVWNLKTRRQTLSIPPSRLEHTWAETMLWAAPDVLAIGTSQEKKGESWDHQIGILYNCKSAANGSLDYKYKKLSARPHDKATLSIAAYPPEGRKIRFLTGGADRKLILWSVDSQFADDSAECSSVHSFHTSAVQGIYYDPHWQIIYSCGADGRLIGWSMEQGKNTLADVKKLKSLRDVLPIPGLPSSLLISNQDGDRNLHVFDRRTHSVVLKFAETGGTTRHVHPSVHPNGHLVSMGSRTDTMISIWDLRYTAVDRGPTQQLDGHSNKVTIAKFYQSSLVSMSNDNTLLFTDYRIRKNVSPENITA